MSNIIKSHFYQVTGKMKAHPNISHTWVLHSYYQFEIFCSKVIDLMPEWEIESAHEIFYNDMEVIYLCNWENK